MFKTPIQYLPETKQLSEQCINDLQLDVVYNNILGEESNSCVRKSWLNDYTTNLDFLKETQTMLSEKTSLPNTQSYEKIDQTLKEIQGNPSFREKYEYITVKMFEQFNKSEPVLQAIAMYTLTSPIISLLMPVVMIFIPFFVLRIMGKPITMANYVEQLKRVFSMMPIGKLFQFGEATWDQRGFILFSIILYIVQMYQNSLTCYRFYKNTQYMAKTIHTMGDYCSATAESMIHFTDCTSNLPTYDGICNSLADYIPKLNYMGKKFKAISFSPFSDMGERMKIFYDLYCDEEYNEIFNYSFGYHEYVKDMHSLSSIADFRQCSFSSSKFSFKGGYYGLLDNENTIKNSYSLKKNGILSGPNASGKTTLLKSTMINTILCQQFGSGFFEKASVIPQDYFHCYINIPDTCDRDSLFQAEARRCKEIINAISSNPDSKHFCVFDELFSGTNPYEAVASAKGYLQFLHKEKNVRYLLTTHYLELCKSFEQSNNVTNYTLEKPYHLQKGISSVKGGIRVLEQLEFPSEILETAKKMVS